MKERGILMSAPMVRATIAGTKTQTRRICKDQPHESSGMVWWPDGKGTDTGTGGGAPGVYLSRCPYGQPGDRLWVRETWQHSNFPLGPYDESCTVFYRADYLDDPHGPDGEKSPEGKYRHWAPSIHMFRLASRITLEITGIRVERLQSISDSDIEAEGTAQWVKDGGSVWSPRLGFDGQLPNADGEITVKPNRVAFCSLWEEINGRGSWDANPWVWVIEFRRVER